MPNRRLYASATTTTFAFRMSREARILLDHLAGEAGTTASHYVRDVFEAHLADLGYDMGEGTLNVAEPDRDTPAGWLAANADRSGA